MAVRSHGGWCLPLPLWALVLTCLANACRAQEYEPNMMEDDRVQAGFIVVSVILGFILIFTICVICRRRMIRDVRQPLISPMPDVYVQRIIEVPYGHKESQKQTVPAFQHPTLSRNQHVAEKPPPYSYNDNELVTA